MNHQEIFDKVANHLLKQNCKSLLPNYRNDTEFVPGLRGGEDLQYKSALGCLILDHVYDYLLEYRSTFELFYYKFLSKEACNIDQNISLYFIDDLRFIHDHFEPQDWRNKLRKFAHKNNLIFDKP